MPYLDFICKFCGRKEVDIKMNISEHPFKRECSNCGYKLEILWTSPPAIELIGDRWSKDNYGIKENNNKNKE